MASDSTETESVDSTSESSDHSGNEDNHIADKCYPTQTRNKPKHLEDYVLTDSDSNVNVTVGYCYQVLNIPTSNEEAINSNERQNDNN